MGLKISTWASALPHSRHSCPRQHHTSKVKFPTMETKRSKIYLNVWVWRFRHGQVHSFERDIVVQDNTTLERRKFVGALANLYGLTKGLCLYTSLYNSVPTWFCTHLQWYVRTLEGEKDGHTRSQLIGNSLLSICARLLKVLRQENPRVFRVMLPLIFPGVLKKKTVKEPGIYTQRQRCAF